ncbi:MAG: aquaporin family protein [Lachnospiraceae bacterium]|uniref:Aquaporin family protein n=1 Tax=Candidatus Weimeria bifida TaxID=2599074 RepID=A0A6N7IXN1_9FIRM|nr:aquaporin family protein [Candidatus Weimeria bifida]RRF95564.1 MAG: aquaporin family protein [Lachnospiraceae bacterium]
MTAQMFLAECLGTMIMIILGDGVCCNVNLKKSGMNGGGSVQIILGWGLAVLLPAYTFGAVSGSHFNPTVTIGALVSSIMHGDGKFTASMAAGYIVAQFIGAFLAACILFVLFHDQFKATDDMATKRGVFCTAPSVRNVGLNFLSEFVCGFLLVFTLDGIGNTVAAKSGMNWFLVYAVIVSIGGSLGGLTGYAMNGARDFGPRLAYALLPIPGEKDPDWGYAWIPIFAPILGGIVAAVLYTVIFG